MIVLGIDPGTRNLGWGVVERAGNQLTHIAHGVIRVDGALSLSVRLVQLAERLETVIDQYRPAVGSVEQIFFHKDPQAAAKLGHARGVILLCLERASVPLREHAPARVKRTLTGNGQAEKPQVAAMVRTLLRLPTSPPADAADALALAITEHRLDPRAAALEEARKKTLRRKLPPHLAAAVARSRAAKPPLGA
ncbi:MAG TPA: crossover junction endodeoxyribonuclease RuvC [Polyangiaceae bacterium]|nr:crossover junction endodeoxyribonuclease RuvC [Polyangiaceae bacterium]